MARAPRPVEWLAQTASVRAGRMPEAESNGVRYLKIPLQIAGPNDTE